MKERTQSTCLLIGAGGTGKTTIILELLLPTFLEFFPAQEGEDRYAILTFSHAQGDAISNETFRAKTAHAAVGCRVASLRNVSMNLATKRNECERMWNPKILVVQDEVSLFRLWWRTCCFSDRCEADRSNMSCRKGATEQRVNLWDICP